MVKFMFYIIWFKCNSVGATEENNKSSSKKKKMVLFN